ncbi:MAG: hypothetical protein OQK13_00855 [Gammaproteobacteria bacterium]|nr:hypothetical protein [Gammaproteobacteria bacterium]
MIIEPGEYSDEQRDKLEELRHKSVEAEKRKAKERRDRERLEAEQKSSPTKVIAPILFALLAAFVLVVVYFAISSLELDRRGMMLNKSAFEDAVERIKQNPTILKASFHQELESVEQIEMKLYIDYMVVDQRAKEIGSEVMMMLSTPEQGSEIEEDEVGSRQYNYRIVMLWLDEREVARGVFATGSQQISWE